MVHPLCGTYDSTKHRYMIKRDGGDWIEVTKSHFLDAAMEAGFGFAVGAQPNGFAHFHLPGGHSLEGRVIHKDKGDLPRYPPAPEEED